MSLPAFDPEAHLDVMVVSHGHLCVVLRNIGAAVYARYNPARRHFEWASVAGPIARVMMYETVSESKLVDELGGGDHGTARAEVCPYEDTPFPEIPAVADQYDGETYLRPGYKARCECGESSLGHYSMASVADWARTHADECETATHAEHVEILEVGPHSEAETVEE